MASTRHLGLGVLETRWFDERHHTVRPLFEFLSYALKDRPDAFTYERFVGAPSFRDAVRFILSGGDVDFLYVAAHGDFSKIEAPDGSGLSRTFLRNSFVDVNRKKRRLKGVLFGSCKFGDEFNLLEMLRPAKIRGAPEGVGAAIPGAPCPNDPVPHPYVKTPFGAWPRFASAYGRARWAS